MIVGIDPSFTGTGICITNDTATEIYYKEKYDCGISVYNNQGYIEGCRRIRLRLSKIIEEVHSAHPDEKVCIICEYPGFRSIGGAWLAILHGMLCTMFDILPMEVEELVWIPPTACDSFTKNKEHKKSYLTKYCVDQGWVPKKINHDQSTALIFCHLYLVIVAGKYSGVSYRYPKAR